jgi:hypothetical protein
MTGVHPAVLDRAIRALGLNPAGIGGTQPADSDVVERSVNIVVYDTDTLVQHTPNRVGAKSKRGAPAAAVSQSKFSLATLSRWDDVAIYLPSDIPLSATLHERLISREFASLAVVKQIDALSKYLVANPFIGLAPVTHDAFRAAYDDLLAAQSLMWPKVENATSEQVKISGANLAPTGTSTVPAQFTLNWGLLRTAKLRPDNVARLCRACDRLTDGSSSAGLPLQPESLDAFLQFWSSINEDAVEPDVIVGPHGYVSAEWFGGPDKLLVMEFHPTKVLFSLGDGADASITGSVPKVDELVRMLQGRQHNPFLWAA